MNFMRLPALLVAAALIACGPPTPPVPPGPVVPAFRGLLATPRQLAFTCVVPGCDTTLTVKVTSNVNRRVAIKRIVLSNPNAEYTITSAEPPPFILGAASDFTIDVRFAVTTAPRSENLEMLITYTDASGEESEERIEAGELKVPLVKRLVGEPLLQATPQTINFGVVPVMTRKELPVTVRNVGFGNIALSVDRADSGVAALQVNLPANIALVPDAGVPLPFVYRPLVEQYLKAEVQLASSTPGVDPVYVTVEGTSHSAPRVALEPEETALEFGEIPKNSRRTVIVKLANVGGQTLNVSNLSATDPTGRVTVIFQGGMSTATLQPLQRIDIEVEIVGTTPGTIDLPLRIVSDDPVRPMLNIPIRAVITEPKLQTDPLMIDWGSVPQSWVVPKQVELKNIGYGALTIRRVTFVGGTSNLFSLRNLPALPMKLDRNARVAFEVEFRAETMAALAGSISIETDDPENPFSEIPLTARGADCTSSCPITNGTPSCAMGACTVGSCNTGWHNTDNSASNGCECREIGSDPGGFCSTGIDKGTLPDNGSSANHTGIIHSTDDEDWVRFFGEDRSQVFSENYDVRITLSSSDPNISMCVSRYGTATGTQCEGATNSQQCGIRTFRKDGAYATEDGAMYYIKIYRNPGAATCTPYTVYMQNG